MSKQKGQPRKVTEREVKEMVNKAYQNKSKDESLEEFHKHREPSQIYFHQSRDSAKEHHDAPLWISRTKELRTLK